jgi:putative ABC transport system permease protein
MSARKRDLAILRALGARRRTVFSAIILEAVAIAGLGMIVGFAVYLGILTGVAWVIRAQTGVVLDPLAPDWVLVWAPVSMISLSALAGIVPAFKAYRTDVAEGLAPES